MDDCIFCQMVAGDIPSDKIYEDEIVYAFLDNHPNNIGHTLVIPKAHARNIFDTPEDTVAHMGKIYKKIATAVYETLNADGVNIYANNEPAAGQVVFHTHTHIIPRYENDGYTLWSGNPELAKDNPAIAEKIKKAL